MNNPVPPPEGLPALIIHFLSPLLRFDPAYELLRLLSTTPFTFHPNLAIVRPGSSVFEDALEGIVLAIFFTPFIAFWNSYIAHLVGQAHRGEWVYIPIERGIDSAEGFYLDAFKLVWTVLTWNGWLWGNKTFYFDELPFTLQAAITNICSTYRSWTIASTEILPNEIALLLLLSFFLIAIMMATRIVVSLVKFSVHFLASVVVFWFAGVEFGRTILGGGTVDEAWVGFWRLMGGEDEDDEEEEEEEDDE